VKAADALKMARGRRAALATILLLVPRRRTIMDRDHDAEASF
jgi:hypothetical protein